MIATYFKDDDPQDERLVYYGFTSSGPAHLPTDSPIGRWNGNFGVVVTADLQINDYIGNATACWAYADKVTMIPALFA
ncbi:hypothetical protein EXU85_10985 [Spirosoma sp. KCTC 42546]|uniref:hypothetical protein n=1 Tax=Spirosoma sp. KCTC 42546 TaxID=2520506 RepID=UPI0011580CCC|nr:hypothetical protein [Spirosoma sp. KCTC 42546]QDK79101.1 hypothetical protein EXU85_10985 [Spirosoma sp. KCTC 42546]